MRGKTFPLLLIAIGVLLLLNTTNILNLGLNLIIPILMMVFGAVKVINSIY